MMHSPDNNHSQRDQLKDNSLEKNRINNPLIEKSGSMDEQQWFANVQHSLDVGVDTLHQDIHLRLQQARNHALDSRKNRQSLPWAIAASVLLVVTGSMMLMRPDTRVVDSSGVDLAILEEAALSNDMEIDDADFYLWADDVINENDAGVSGGAG